MDVFYIRLKCKQSPTSMTKATRSCDRKYSVCINICSTASALITALSRCENIKTASSRNAARLLMDMNGMLKINVVFAFNIILVSFMAKKK